MNKQRIALIVVSIFLVATAVLGILNGLDDLPYAESTGQQLVSLTTCFYGIVAIVAVLGFVRKRKWAFWLMIIWALACGSAAVTATLFYGDANLSVAAISGAGTLMIAAPFVWLGWWLHKQP